MHSNYVSKSLLRYFVNKFVVEEGALPQEWPNVGSNPNIYDLGTEYKIYIANSNDNLYHNSSGWTDIDSFSGEQAISATSQNYDLKLDLKYFNHTNKVDVRNIDFIPLDSDDLYAPQRCTLVANYRLQYPDGTIIDEFATATFRPDRRWTSPYLMGRQIIIDYFDQNVLQSARQRVGTDYYYIESGQTSLSVSDQEYVFIQFAEGQTLNNTYVCTVNQYAETPVITESFSEPTGTITISCATSGASIYYTTDGTTPTTSSTLYTQPIQITGYDIHRTIKAVAYNNSHYSPGVATHEYYSKLSAPTVTYTKNGITVTRNNSVSGTAIKYCFVDKTTYEGNWNRTNYTPYNVVANSVSFEVQSDGKLKKTGSSQDYGVISDYKYIVAWNENGSYKNSDDAAFYFKTMSDSLSNIPSADLPRNAGPFVWGSGYGVSNQDTVYFNLITAGSSYYDWEYSTDQTTWSSSVPEASEPGTYTVWYRLAVPSDVHTLVSSTYGTTGSNDYATTIIEKRSASNIALYIKYNASIYNSNSRPIRYTGQPESLLTGTLYPSQNGVYKTYWYKIFTVGDDDHTAPSTTDGFVDYDSGNFFIGGTDSGKYSFFFYVDVIDTVHYTPYQTIIHFGTGSINRANLTIVSSPYARDPITYTGNAQNLVYNGIVTGGQCAFAIYTGSVPEPNDYLSSYSTSLPTGINQGTYNIAWLALPDSNHKGSTYYSYEWGGTFQAVIGKGTAIVTAAPVIHSSTIEYDLQTHQLTTAGQAQNGTMYYRVGTTGTQQANPISRKDIGSYELYYTVTSSNSNYDDVPNTLIGTVSIVQGTNPYTTLPAAIDNLVWNGDANVSPTNQNLITAGVPRISGMTVKYAVNSTNNNEPQSYYTSIPQGQDAGLYRVWYRLYYNDVNESGNFVGGSGRINVTISKKTCYFSVAPSWVTSQGPEDLDNGRYWFYELPWWETVGGSLYVSNTDGNYNYWADVENTVLSTTSPGTYEIYYKIISNNSNYQNSETFHVTCVVSSESSGGGGESGGESSLPKAHFVNEDVYVSTYTNDRDVEDTTRYRVSYINYWEVVGGHLCVSRDNVTYYDIVTDYQNAHDYVLSAETTGVYDLYFKVVSNSPEYQDGDLYHYVITITDE